MSKPVISWKPRSHDSADFRDPTVPSVGPPFDSRQCAIVAAVPEPMCAVQFNSGYRGACDDTMTGCASLDLEIVMRTIWPCASTPS